MSYLCESRWGELARPTGGGKGVVDSSAARDLQGRAMGVGFATLG